MKKTGFVALVIFALSLVACDEFFSTSWGDPREYEQSNIKVTGGNVEKWEELAVGNPELGIAIGEKIATILSDPNSSLSAEEKNKIRKSGIRIAVEASGIGEAILTQAADVLGEFDNDENPNEDVVRDIFKKIQKDFNAKNGKEAAELITQIVSVSGPVPGVPPKHSEAPQFDPPLDDLSPAEVAQAIIVLALGAIKDDIDLNNLTDEDWKKIENLVDGLRVSSTGQVVVDETGGKTPSDEALVLAAYLNHLISDPKFDDNTLTSALKKLPFFE